MIITILKIAFIILCIMVIYRMCKLWFNIFLFFVEKDCYWLGFVINAIVIVICLNFILRL